MCQKLNILPSHTKGGAQTCFTDISDIHAFSKHIWALTLAEAQCYIWHVELGYVLGMCRQQNVIWFLSETDTHVNGMYVPWQSHPLGSGVVPVSHHKMESTVCGDWYTCLTYTTQTTHPDTQWESDTADKLTFLCLGTAKDWGWKLAISSHMWLIYMYVHRLPSKKKLIYKCSSIFLQTETTQLSIKILPPVTPVCL